MAPAGVLDLRDKPASKIISVQEIVPEVMTTKIPDTSGTSLTHHGPTQSRTVSGDDYRSATTSLIIWAHTSVPSPAPSRSQPSGYARPSPSTFLYSAPIPTVQNSSTSSSPSVLGAVSKINYDFPDLPTGFRIVLFICVGLGLLWALVVYWVNFPPSFFTTQPSSGLGEISKKHYRWYKDVWYTKWIPGCTRDARKNKKPIDKPSKYAPVPTSASSTSTFGSGIPPPESTLSLPLHRMNDGRVHSSNNGNIIELRSRKSQPTQPETPVFLLQSPCPGPVFQESSPNTKTHARSASTPSLTSSAAPPIPIPNCYSSPRSPENPFLPTPHLKPKSSAEWLRDREVFLARDSTPALSTFSASNIESFTGRLSSVSPDSPVSSLHLGDIEPMKAQVTDSFFKQSTRHGYGGHLGRISHGMNEYKKRDSWLDKVDGAVMRVAGKVAKWTADDGGKEGLLLPLSKKNVE